MRLTHLLSIGVFSAVGFASFSSADVGVLDKYDCHNHQQTDDYHCHGPEHLSKLGGFSLGADARVQAWSVSNGDLYLFAGVAANAEYSHKWLAATASYFMMPLVNSVDGELQLIDSIFQQGWEAGVKFGPGVGRFGSKAYLTGGWSSSDLTDSGDSTNNGTLSGYYAGIGFGHNTQTLTFDAVATYRDPTTVSDYLLKVQGESLDVLSFDTRVILGWNF